MPALTDLSIAIHPPKSTPSAFEYKYPCGTYPNKSSFTTASNPSENLYLNAYARHMNVPLKKGMISKKINPIISMI